MRTITGETKLFGLLSHGAKFTLSPAMHNRAAQLLHKDQVYVHFDLPSDKVSSFLDVFWHMGGQGLNVTMPHKSLVASLVETDGLNSVNTLTRTATGWKGHSTDGDGFILGLKRDNITLSDFDFIIILGSGGAAQSIAAAIADHEMERALPTVILRRSRGSDAQMSSASRNAPIQIMTFRDLSPESFLDTMRATMDSRRLVIQATSAPKNGDRMASYVTALDFFTKSDVLVDLIYDHPSDLYYAAIARNIRCQDGLPMLVEQARLSQHLWWGKSASFDDMLIAIRQSGWRG